MALIDDLEGQIGRSIIWYAAVDDVLGRYGDQLDGKVVVDITNPIDVDAFEPLELQAGSAAQEIAAKAPGAKVVKAQRNAVLLSTRGASPRSTLS